MDDWEGEDNDVGNAGGGAGDAREEGLMMVLMTIVEILLWNGAGRGRGLGRVCSSVLQADQC